MLGCFVADNGDFLRSVITYFCGNNNVTFSSSIGLWWASFRILLQQKSLLNKRAQRCRMFGVKSMGDAMTMIVPIGMIHELISLSCLTVATQNCYRLQERVPKFFSLIKFGN